MYETLEIIRLFTISTGAGIVPSKVSSANITALIRI